MVSGNLIPVAYFEDQGKKQGCQPSVAKISDS